MNINTTNFQYSIQFKKMEFEEEAIFKHPFRCLIAGPSESGKTNLV